MRPWILGPLSFTRLGWQPCWAPRSPSRRACALEGRGEGEVGAGAAAGMSPTGGRSVSSWLPPLRRCGRGPGGALIPQRRGRGWRGWPAAKPDRGSAVAGCRDSLQRGLSPRGAGRGWRFCYPRGGVEGGRSCMPPQVRLATAATAAAGATTVVTVADHEGVVGMGGRAAHPSLSSPRPVPVGPVGLRRAAGARRSGEGVRDERVRAGEPGRGQGKCGRGTHRVERGEWNSGVDKTGNPPRPQHYGGALRGSTSTVAAAAASPLVTPIPHALPPPFIYSVPVSSPKSRSTIISLSSRSSVTSSASMRRWRASTSADAALSSSCTSRRTRSRQRSSTSTRSR